MEKEKKELTIMAQKENGRDFVFKWQHKNDYEYVVAWDHNKENDSWVHGTYFGKDLEGAVMHLYGNLKKVRRYPICEVVATNALQLMAEEYDDTLGDFLNNFNIELTEEEAKFFGILYEWKELKNELKEEYEND